MFFADGFRIGSDVLSKPKFFADGKEIVYAWIKLTGGATRTFLIRGTNGKKCCVDFGDGSAIADYTLLGTSTNVPIAHAYAAGTYVMRIYGDLLSVTYMTGVSQGILNFYAPKSFRNITNIDFSNNSLTSLSGFENLVSMGNINVSNNSIVDVSALACMPNVTQLRLYNNNIVDIYSIRIMTSLSVALLYSNSITDISCVENLDNITYLRVYSNSVDTLPDSFPVWDSAEIRFDSNGVGFPTDECLQKMAASGMTNNTINIAGTNPARTQPDTDAALNTMVITNGNTVTVNEVP